MRVNTIFCYCTGCKPQWYEFATGLSENNVHVFLFIFLLFLMASFNNNNNNKPNRLSYLISYYDKLTDCV